MGRSSSLPPLRRRIVRRVAAPSTRPRSKGQSIAEMAIVAPILLILLAGAIDLGRLFYSQVTIANAAREAALAAAQDPTKYEPNQNCVPPTHGPATNRVICAAMFLSLIHI